MRKLFICAAAGVLAALQIAAPAAAVTVTDSFDPSKTGSITLVKLRENDGVMKNGTGLADTTLRNTGMRGIEFSALRIAEYSVGNDNGSIGIYFTNPDSGFLELLAAKGIHIEAERNGLYTAEALDQGIKTMKGITGTTPGETEINRYVKEHASCTFPRTETNGSTSVSGLPLGLYLIAETDSSGYSEPLSPEGTSEMIGSGSSPFLVALPMTNQGKIGSAKPGTVWQYDVTAYPKNTTVSIPKYIVSAADNKTLLISDDREIGAVITQVIASSAPAVVDGHIYEKYVITDTMDPGLSFVQVKEVRLGAYVSDPKTMEAFESFSVLTAGTDYKVSGKPGEHGFSVIMTKSGLKKLNERGMNSQVAVFFDSRLTKDAEDGKAAANTNQPTLAWKNSNGVEKTLKGNIPRIFSYHIDVKKRGLTDASKAVFRVKRAGDASDVYFVMESSGVYHTFDETNDDAAAKTAVISPAKNGNLSLRGFDAGKYEFSELATQEGHELLKASVMVELTANDPCDGILASAKASSDGKTANLSVSKGTASFSVDNQSSLILKAGGTGVGFMYIAGLLLAAIAASAGIMQKRRNMGRSHEREKES